METVQENEARVEQYLLPRMARLLHVVRTLATDPRHAQGKRHPFENMTLAMLAGLLIGGSPRTAERQSQRMGLGQRGKPIGDTTMHTTLSMSDGDAWLPVLVQTVKDMQRRGQLQSDGLRGHWMAIDGKYETLDHHADGLAQKFADDEKCSIYWRLGMLRAVLISAAGRPAVGQWAIGPVDTTETAPEKIKFTGEITNLWPFVTWLRKQYGDLAENFTLDAGLWSRQLFAQFDAEGLGIFGNLKENKPELFGEAARVLRIAQGRRGPDAVSDWEPCKKGQIKRELWRETTLDGWNGWHHLRQVIVVKQTTRMRDKDSPDEVELRYFATNLPAATMTPRQLLLLVRRHWAIENDCNWSFDMVMGEDDGAWCTQGKAVLALGVLRMIAYNLM